MPSTISARFLEALFGFMAERYFGMNICKASESRLVRGLCLRWRARLGLFGDECNPEIKSSGWRRKVALLLAEIFVNFVLSSVIYVKTQATFGQVHALLAFSVPPILWTMVEFVRKPRVNPLSLIVIAGIILSLLAFFGGGSVKFLQSRANPATGVIGLVFLGSVAIGRPLVYHLARASMARKSQAEAENFAEFRGENISKRQ
jgi:hypothetical protein